MPRRIVLAHLTPGMRVRRTCGCLLDVVREPVSSGLPGVYIWFVMVEWRPTCTLHESRRFSGGSAFNVGPSNTHYPSLCELID